MSNINAQNIMVTNLTVTNINGVKYNPCNSCCNHCQDDDCISCDDIPCDGPCSHCCCPSGITGPTGPQGNTGPSNPNASSINVVDTNIEGVYYPTFVSGAGSNQIMRIDASNNSLTYNPFTNVMSFTAPPTSTVNATGTTQLVRWDNFTSIPFTPKITSSGGGTCNYFIQSGQYTKIGNMVSMPKFKPLQ